MKSVLSFVSLLAFSVLIIGISVVVLSGSGAPTYIEKRFSLQALDLPSVLIGFLVGFVLSHLTRVRWSEIPRQILYWLIEHERAFYRVALVVVLLVAVIYA